MSTMGKIIHKRDRARCEIVGDDVRKMFMKQTALRANCFARELLARRIFAGKDWLSPILRHGRWWFDMPHYPEACRLTHAAARMGRAERLAAAKQTVKAAFDIFEAGYAHCDLHAGNLFWIDGQIILIDFEMLRRYPPGRRPAFPLSYDISGFGLKPPFSARVKSCYTQRSHISTTTWPLDPAVEPLLGVTAAEAIDELIREFRNRLRTVSSTFQTKKKRHRARVQNIYSSFSLPHMEVPLSEARRDSAHRLEEFRLTDVTVRGKRVLDLGCHMGGMLFEMQKFSPGQCVGVEYDESKVTLANSIAAFNGLSNVRFMRADIDRIKQRKVRGRFDLVLCLAIEAHVNDKTKLYQTLRDATAPGGLLCFEGNYSTSVRRVAKLLVRNGFTDIRHLGRTNDDRFDKKNRRRLLLARRQA